MARRKIDRLRADVIEAARWWSKGATPFWMDPPKTASALLRERLEALDAYCIGIPNSPGSFAQGSDTSKTASLMSPIIAGSARRKVVDELLSLYGRPSIGLTDSELEARLRLKHETLSSARNWLMNAGWIRDSGKRRLNPSKRPATVWTLTEAGHTRLLTKGTA